MKNLNSKSFRKFVEKLQNPTSYSPLIGTVIGSIPIFYTMAVSLGLTSISNYLEYQEEKRDLRNNGFYFLLKIK